MLTYDFLNEASTKLAKFHSIKYEIPSIKFKTHHERVFLQLGPQFQGKFLSFNFSIKNFNKILTKFIGMMLSIDKEIEKIDEYPYNEFPR